MYVSANLITSKKESKYPYLEREKVLKKNITQVYGF